MALALPFGNSSSSYTVSAGGLPEGLQLSGARIEGKAVEPGTFGFEILVRTRSSLRELGRQSFSLIVDPDTDKLKIWTRRLEPATELAAWSQTINTTGGRLPYRFAVTGGQLPSGVALDARSGVLAGKPRDTGVYAFRIEVKDLDGVKYQRNLYLVVVSKESGRPTVSLIASRTTGSAPLSVFFDATGTRSTTYPRSFHDLHHDWRFDDQVSPHRSSTGPLAAHVFEDPGTYVVRLTSTDPDGKTGTTTVRITVGDADEVFAGTKTVCFANTNVFTGAPQGSRRVVTASFDEASQYVGPGVRLLFRRGDTFASKSSVLVAGGKPTTVGAFGVGKDPDVKGKFANNPIVVCHGEVPLLVQGEDVRIMDLSFVENPGDKSLYAISADSRVTKCLVLRVDTKGFNTPVTISHDVVAFLKQAAHEEFMLADSVLQDARWMSLYMGGVEFAFVGNTVARSETQHILRVTFARKLVIDGNSLFHPAKSTHCIKLHALHDAVAKKVYGDATEQVVIRDNEVRGDTAWLATLGPQNALSNEVVRDVLVEKNRFVGESGADVYLYVNSADTTIRNNLFISEGALKGRPLIGIAIIRRGIEPVPSGVRVFHNTFYDAGAGHSSDSLVDIGAHKGKVLVFNNLAYAPLVKNTVVVKGGAFATAVGNLDKGDPRFVNAKAGDFRPGAGSPAIGGGVVAPVVDDYSGHLRDLRTSERDVGALRHR